MKIKFKFLIILIVFSGASPRTFGFESSLVQRCESLFSANLPPKITIAQATVEESCFAVGICNLDAGEILNQMMLAPKEFDMKQVKVLMLGDVTIGAKDWRMHVAIYDGKGFVYDPGFHNSRTIEPVAVEVYAKATMDKHPSLRPTQIRVISPQRFLQELPVDINWSLFFFGYGMDGMGIYKFTAQNALNSKERSNRNLPIGPEVLRDLPKIMNKSEFLASLGLLSKN